MSFVNTDLAVRSKDGHNFILLENLVFVRKDGTQIRARVASTTDGISTPRFIWTIIPPFGQQWFPGILHDAAYRDTLDMMNPDGKWIPFTMTRDEADSLIREALLSNGVGVVETETIYAALRQYGQAAFDQDRQQ